MENLISPLLQAYTTTQEGGEVWLFNHVAFWGHMKNVKEKLKFIRKN